MVEIKTLGDLADALAELKEAQEAHASAKQLQSHSHIFENPRSWAMRDADVHNAADRVAELRAQPVTVALPAELCEAMRAQFEHAANFPDGTGEMGHAQFLTEQCAAQWRLAGAAE